MLPFFDFVTFQPLFMTTTYAGYIGVITGCRHGAFSISGDQRNKGHLWENLLSGVEESWPTFFLERMVRDWCSKCTSSERNVPERKVHNVPMLATPCQGDLLKRRSRQVGLKLKACKAHSSKHLRKNSAFHVLETLLWKNMGAVNNWQSSSLFEKQTGIEPAPFKRRLLLLQNDLRCCCCAACTVTRTACMFHKKLLCESVAKFSTDSNLEKLAIYVFCRSKNFVWVGAVISVWKNALLTYSLCTQDPLQFTRKILTRHIFPL